MKIGVTKNGAISYSWMSEGFVLEHRMGVKEFTEELVNISSKTIFLLKLWRRFDDGWGGVSFEARTDLVIMNSGVITADGYITKVLEPFAPFIRGDFMLMHDNHRPHIARIVSGYFKSQ